MYLSQCESRVCENTLPCAFIADRFENVFLIGDAKDILCDMNMNRNHIATGKAQYSSKMSAPAIRGASSGSLYCVSMVPGDCRVLYDKGCEHQSISA